ncbi:hypothetical protein HY256_08725 [Candidatus Sumerlaeota bacterium]|nr:hypothetical protein [Candidatus Sumerlaeota bacterium]
MQQRLDDADLEIDDFAILSLYATFEAKVREFVTAQSENLLPVLGLTDPFQSALFKEVVGWSFRKEMDGIRRLFNTAVGADLASKVGSIEAYRHWVAHGKRWAQPPLVDPDDAFIHLNQFLISAGIITP